MSSPGDGCERVHELQISPRPYLTADLPGIGGRLKTEPGDFVVEEVPAYEPSGEGEHLFLWIEKCDSAADDLLRHIGRALRVSPRDIGTAGTKDQRAITRQYVSVPARCEPDIPRIETDRIHVITSRRHGNKLRTGHLNGNRFSILIRDVSPSAIDNAPPIIDAVRECGFPNYFGDQRFGRELETLRLGFELIRGTRSPASIPPSRRRFLLRMAVSAVQSVLFNAVLADRLRDDLLQTVLVGDVMEVIASGGKFVASDVAAEQARFDQRETVLTGPIFGPKMTQPTREPAEREQRILSTWNLTEADFERFSQLTSGTRRPLVVWPTDLRVEANPDGLRFEFTLPSGAYATTLLGELMKTG